MSGQETDQVERWRNSGVERENYVISRQHRGNSSVCLCFILRTAFLTDITDVRDGVNSLQCSFIVLPCHRMI